LADILLPSFTAIIPAAESFITVGTRFNLDWRTSNIQSIRDLGSGYHHAPQDLLLILDQEARIQALLKAKWA
jgi:hypothetical protein